MVRFIADGLLLRRSQQPTLWHIDAVGAAHPISGGSLRDGHWRTTIDRLRRSTIAGLRRTGIVAPLVLDGSMTGQTFRAYVERFLAPALSPGDVVVPPRAGCARPLQGSDQAPAGA